MQLKNDLILRALAGEQTEQTPVWLMRQAGRYLPEYRAVRAEAGSFMALATNPELAAEVTVQPLRHFPLDAAIIFSDILTVPDAMGLGLYFKEGEGPHFEYPIRSEEDLRQLQPIVAREDLSYVMEAIRVAKREINGAVPLIGFAGSPFTLACYMVEGKGSKNFIMTKKMMYQYPELLHKILNAVKEVLVDYLTAQVEAGADLLQIFDTWGGTLSTPAFRAFSLSYTAEIIEALRRNPLTARVPIITFTKDAPVAWYQMYAEETQTTAIGVDWRHELSDVATVLPQMPLQGNLDPLALLGSESYVVERTQEIIKSLPASTPHIFNLGHGMEKSVPPERVALLVDTVHATRRG